MSKNYFKMAFDALRKKVISVRDIIEWHGVESLFSYREYDVFPGTISVSIAEYAVFILSEEGMHQNGEAYGLNLSNLREIGRILLSKPTPWLKKNALVGDRVWNIRHLDYGRPWRSRNSGAEKKVRSDPDAMFAIFALTAAYLESLGEKDGSNFKKSIEARFPDPFRAIFLARFANGEKGKSLKSQFDWLHFRKEQSEFVEAWVRRETKLMSL